MKSKRILLIIFFIYLIVSSFSYSAPNICYNTVELGLCYVRPNGENLTKDDIQSANVGSGFIAKYKGNFYLISNYHVMVNRHSYDTTVYDQGWSQIPNTVIVFYRNKDNERITQVLNLIKGNKRLFFSYPANRKTRSTRDLAILPIPAIPKNAINKYVNFDNIDTNWIIKKGSQLMICGYKGDVNLSLPEPILDSVHSVQDKIFNYNDQWIYAIKKFSISGDSGSPVYCFFNGKPVLVGMGSLSTNSSLRLDQEFFKGRDPMVAIHIFEGLKTIVNGLKIAHETFKVK